MMGCPEVGHGRDRTRFALRPVRVLQRVIVTDGRYRYPVVKGPARWVWLRRYIEWTTPFRGTVLVSA